MPCARGVSFSKVFLILIFFVFVCVTITKPLWAIATLRVSRFFYTLTMDVYICFIVVQALRALAGIRAFLISFMFL